MSDDAKVSDEAQRDEDFEAYEEKLDELNDGLLEAYAAGFSLAVETFGLEPEFATDVDSLKQNQKIAERHYYYWDGKTKPLQFWLREHFLDDEQLVTDGGEVEATALDREPAELTDNVGIMSLTTREFNDEEHVTTVPLDELRRAINIADELGWSALDLDIVPPRGEGADYPLLAIRHPGGIVAGSPAAVTVAPKTEKGREQSAEWHREEADDAQ